MTKKSAAEYEYEGRLAEWIADDIAAYPMSKDDTGVPRFPREGGSMSFNELDSLMMHADIANQEAKERFTCAVCDPDVPNPDVDWCNACGGGVSKKRTHRPALDPNAANPREPFVAVPIKGET